MPELTQVMEALRNADASGNVEDAKRLAVIANKLKSDGTSKEPKESGGALPFVNRAIAGTIGAPVDAITTGINYLPGVNIKEPFLGRKSVESGMESIGIELPKEGQDPSTIPEHIGRSVGEVAGLIIPAGAMVSKISKGAGVAARVASDIWKSMIKHPYLAMAGEATGGVGAGVGRGVAEKEFPDSPGIQSSIEMGSGLVGSMSPTALVHAPTAVSIRAGKNILNKLLIPFTKKGGTYRAGEYAKGLVPDADKAAKNVAEETIADLPPAVASGEKKIVTLYKSLVGQDPVKDAEAIENMTTAMVKLEGEMRKFGYGSPELLAEITEKRVAALELGMDQRIITASKKAQAKMDALPVAKRKAVESRIVKQELENAMFAERALEKKAWSKVKKDMVTGFEKTRDTYQRLYNDLGRAQRVDIPTELKTSKIINGKKNKATTLREMQSLRSKLLESERIARKNGEWNKARIAGDVADAILEDLGIVANHRVTITAAVVKDTEGNIYKGPTHHLAMEQLDKSGKNFDPASGDLFATDKNRILTREEAAALTGSVTEDAADMVGRESQSMASGASSDLQAALAFSRQFKTRFESGEVGKILGYSKSGAPAINPDLTLEMTVGRMGERGAIDIDKVVVSPEAQKATQRWLARSFTDYTDPNSSGAINPVKAERWIKNNEAILDKYPDFRNQLIDAEKSQSLADETRIRMQERKKTLRDPRISESARFLNKADMGVEVQSILKAPHPSRTANELVKQANKDTTGKALDGLRAGFVEHILEKSHLGSYNELGEKTLSGRAMLGFVKENESVLRQVFDNNQISRMKRIGGELSKIESFEKANPGKSEIEMKDWASNTLRMFGRLTGARLGGKVGAQTMGGSLQYAQIFASRGQKFMTWLSKDMAQQLIHDAILSKDPALLKSLLRPISKPTPSKKDLIILNKNLNLWLMGTGKRVIDNIETEEGVK